MPISEEHPLVPKSAYGQSKLTIENYLAFYGRTTELEVSILRLSNPYGPRQNPLGVQGVIAVAMGCAMDGRPMTLFGRGEAVRDYIYIDDIIEAMLLAAAHPPAVLNVSSGVGRSVAEVTDEVERVSGRPIARVYAPPRPGDVSANVLDNRRAQALLNWRPQIDFGEGVGRSWHWLSHLRQ